MHPAAFIHHNWSIFLVLLKVPFQHMALVWGIVPLYFGWLFNELTSKQASFSTAIQTGFSFLWAGLHWGYLYWHRSADAPVITISRLLAVNLFVTILVIGIGIVALASGIRHRYPKRCAFLGHTRFGNYFMITIFPMQANYLAWSWSRLGAILFFAVPTWCLLYCLVKPLRR